jgi:monovalent cation:H+ antiporter-2, CPA2 family
LGFLSNVRSALGRGRGRNTPACGHLDQIRDVRRGSEGCEQCIALGDTWVHLRMCMTCGQVGCCDSSKNRHASKHARDSAPDHQIIRSLEPGEQWLWCFTDQITVQAPR